MGRSKLTAFLGVRKPNFTKLGHDIGLSLQHGTFVSEFEYLAAFSKLSDVENDTKFCTF